MISIFDGISHYLQYFMAIKNNFHLPSPLEENLPKLFRQKYFHSMDGLRALSIILVILSHIGLSYKIDYNFHALANLGVQFFFVISGFLITALLMKEKIITGKISLKKFYLRRFFRIIPVAFLYLFFILFLKFITHINLNFVYILTSFLFIRNYFMGSKGIDHLTTHYWSLSVEEQFYLIFPIILKKSLSFYIYFLLSMLILSVLTTPINIYFPELSANGLFKIITIFLNSFTSISIGSLTAILIYKKIINFEKIPYRQPAITLLFIFIFSISSYQFLGNTMIKGILFGIILLLNLTNNNITSTYYRVLNNKNIKYIGILSFSLYIWQQPLTLNLNYLNSLNFMQSFTNKLAPNILITVLSLLVLFTISYISYNFYEKRFLKIKNRFK